MIEYLSRGEVAERLGVALPTIDGHVRRGYMPEPDARIGRNYGWLPSTIDEWTDSRPGRGTRTDLTQSCPA
ncbi:hypothetical protein GCM10023094_23620 [Rhodococcus olei]|uniref:AlpA family transcriptional regulator n=1 Tax=Rhodococcus olei TaxID=2161675 RepID=A0ABP8P2T8_9NOCA